MKGKVHKDVPDVSMLRRELKREQYKFRYAAVLKSTVYTLVVVAAFAVLVATLWMPVLQIYGNSMTPTLKEGQIVVSVKGSHFEKGDLVAFYLGNKLLVKRVLAGPGQTVNILEDGTVYVDGQEQIEPYVSEKALGECDLKMPYQVPESRFFLIGDHREAPRWTAAAARSAAWRRSRWWEKSYFVFGPFLISEKSIDDCGREDLWISIWTDVPRATEPGTEEIEYGKSW